MTGFTVISFWSTCLLKMFDFSSPVRCTLVERSEFNYYYLSLFKVTGSLGKTYLHVASIHL